MKKDVGALDASDEAQAARIDGDDDEDGGARRNSPTARYHVPPTHVVGARPSLGLPTGTKLLIMKRSAHQYLAQSSECFFQWLCQNGPAARLGATFQKKKSTAARTGTNRKILFTT